MFDKNVVTSVTVGVRLSGLRYCRGRADANLFKFCTSLEFLSLTLFVPHCMSSWPQTTVHYPHKESLGIGIFRVMC